jgi:hypothetical protein
MKHAWFAVVGSGRPSGAPGSEDGPQVEPAWREPWALPRGCQPIQRKRQFVPAWLKSVVLQKEMRGLRVDEIFAAAVQSEEFTVLPPTARLAAGASTRDPCGWRRGGQD